MATAEEIIAAFQLIPHPIEGGYFRETYRSEGMIPAEFLPGAYAQSSARTMGTAIYYLLTADTFSEMHRVPTEEIFHFYLGGPVRMLQLFPGGGGREVVIGADIASGQHPQLVVPAGVWQGSRLEAGAELALLGATMAPGFEYADYERGRRDELIGLYPTFEEQIRRLTRSAGG